MRAGRPIASLLAILLLACGAGGADAKVFEPETFTLDNGMQVVVVTNRAVPVVTHMVWYEVGAADDPPGKSGIAHFLEHLMFRGTHRHPDGEFNRLVTRQGGESNAFTTADSTAYFQTVATDRLEMVMELEADRMSGLALDADIVATERDVILEERRQRIDNDPGARLGEQAAAAMFLNHPYGRPIIGWEHEMAGLTLADAQAFYEAWYSPGNAILVVSGDIDAATLRPLAETFYGAIPKRPVPVRMRPQEPEPGAARRVVLADPGVEQPAWRKAWLAPTYGSSAGPEPYALQVLSEILGSGSTSRLYRALVVERQLAVAAGSFYSAEELDPSPFTVYLAPRQGVALQTLETALGEVLDRLLADGVGEDEVAAAKERLVIAAIYARDGVFGPARTLGAALAAGGTVEAVEAWPDRIAAVTAGEVLAAARAVIDDPGSVTAILLPAEPGATLAQ